ncbi:M48 family metallopeptidase [Rhodobacteraceae bacterium CCMM004]|nr:M48 family metallopeptidase [Rhodobacteraceae bacterium CCMM004]
MSTVIHVGPRPARFVARAELLDGRHAALTPAAIAIDEAARALRIEAPGQAPWLWPLTEVRSIPDQADRSRMVLAWTGDPVARLLVDDAEAQFILRARCPDLHRRPRPKGLGRLGLWAVAAVGAVALIVMILVPALANRLADYLPPEGERALGDTTLGQIRAALDTTGAGALPVCEGPEGVAALDALAQRLTAPDPLPAPLTVTVLDFEGINALALPGGHVVFFRGLIDAAESPDEVAGVFAHELGHVAARDPTRIALRSAGSVGVLGLLFGDFAGGAVVLFLTERLIQARYSQEVEAAADAFAVDRLRAAGIDPGGLADFFQRLAEEHGDDRGILAHFAHHPELMARISAVRAQPFEGTATPALAPDQWAALRAICD